MMKRIITGVIGFWLFAATALPLFAQDVEDLVQPQSSPALRPIHVEDLETLIVYSLRKEFPQLPGMFALVHSCRLPEYGPFVSVTLQLPANFITKPVLLELERRHRLAEEQARRMRAQVEKAAQIITLKIREAGLLEQIETEESTRKKGKQQIVDDLKKDLEETRGMLNSLQVSENSEIKFASDIPSDVDLNKMLISNYNQIFQRVSNAMKQTLVENAPRIADLGENEKVAIHAHIRDNFAGSSGSSVLFVLQGSDIEAFLKGDLDSVGLKEKITVQREKKE